MAVSRILTPSNRYVGYVGDTPPEVADGAELTLFDSGGQPAAFYRRINGEWVQQADLPTAAEDRTNDLLALVLHKLCAIHDLLALAIHGGG